MHAVRWGYNFEATTTLYVERVQDSNQEIAEAFTWQHEVAI